MPLVHLFLDICLLKKGPQDCPPSSPLLGLMIGANLLVGALLSLAGSDLADALAQTLVGVVLLAAFLLGALYLTGKLPRWQQTGTAAFGCDTLIGIAAGLLMLVGEMIPALKEPVWMLMLLLLLWQIAVLGHILRHALNLPFVAGIGISLAYFLVSFRILTSLFPVVD